MAPTTRNYSRLTRCDGGMVGEGGSETTTSVLLWRRVVLSQCITVKNEPKAPKFHSERTRLAPIKWEVNLLNSMSILDEIFTP